MIEKSLNLEVSKAWFDLAQLLGVAAGLFMIATGFMIVTPQDQAKLYLDSIYLCERVINSDLNNINPINYSLSNCLIDYGASFGKDIKKINNFAIVLFFTSILLMINSFIFWVIGRKKIFKESLNDTRYFWGILAIDSLILLVLLILGIVLN